MVRVSLIILAFTVMSISCGGGGGSSTTTATNEAAVGDVHRASYQTTTPGGFLETGIISFNENTGILEVSGTISNCGDTMGCTSRGTWGQGSTFEMRRLKPARW